MNERSGLALTESCGLSITIFIALVLMDRWLRRVHA